MKLTAMAHEENRGFQAEIQALPGCVTQTENLTEPAKKLQEATGLWIETAEESAKKEGKLILQVIIYETTSR